MWLRNYRIFINFMHFAKILNFNSLKEAMVENVKPAKNKLENLSHFPPVKYI